MAFEFRLPDIGEGVVEGEIVRWLVKAGDHVREDQPIVEVLTDKATVEISSPRAGRVLETRGAEGGIAQVHSVILVLEEGAGDAATAASTAPTASAASAAEGIHAGSHVLPTAPSRTEAASAAPPPPSGATAPRAAPASGSRSEPPAAPAAPLGRVLATPATRHLARELGVEIGTVRGTGDGGRVTKDDVHAAAIQTDSASAGVPVAPVGPEAAPRPAAASGKPIPPDPGAEERIPIRGLRKKISEAMVASKTTIPHFTYVDEVDMGALAAVRERWKGPAEKRGVKLTYLPFFMKACVAAFRDFPHLNAWMDDAANELVVKKVFHIGVSIDTPQGLFVGVVRDVDRKSILEIGADLNGVVARVRDGKATREDLTGSTFTITSVGNFGGMLATPIINKPEVAILGMNRVHERPVARGGQVVVRPMMYLSPTFDHRVVDGAVGARFTNRLKALVEDPDQLFLELR